MKYKEFINKLMVLEDSIMDLDLGDSIEGQDKKVNEILLVLNRMIADMLNS